MEEFLPNSHRIYVMSTYENILEKGRELGREEGLELGREEGLELGREEGLELGREEGLELGREEEKLNQQTKTILNGFDKKKLSVSDLSELLEVSEEYVLNILKENGRIPS